MIPARRTELGIEPVARGGAQQDAADADPPGCPRRRRRVPCPAPTAERREYDDVGQPGERRPVGHQPAERECRRRADDGKAARRRDRPLVHLPRASRWPSDRRAAIATRPVVDLVVIGRQPLAGFHARSLAAIVGDRVERNGAPTYSVRRSMPKRGEPGGIAAERVVSSSALNTLTSKGGRWRAPGERTRPARSAPGRRLTPSACSQPTRIVSRWPHRR